MQSIVATLLALCASAGSARAAELERLEVSEASGTYRISSSVIVDASRDAVAAALLDFADHKKIAPHIEDVSVLETSSDGESRVRLVTTLCIGPFCSSLEQLQAVRFIPPGVIRARTLPSGDVRSGSTVWELTSLGSQTRVQSEIVLQPRKGPPFFIPKGCILRELRRQASRSAAGLEALARELAQDLVAHAAERPGTHPEAQAPPPAQATLAASRMALRDAAP